MAKSLRTTHLTARLNNNAVAKTSDVGKIAYFSTSDNKRRIHKTTKGLRMVTPKGQYLLVKHATNNYYYGICAGVKVQVSLKKVVGSLRAWY